MPPTALPSALEALPPHGRFSVWWGPLDGDPWLCRDDEAQHYAASTMKLALVLAAYRLADAGELDLDQPVSVHDGFSSAAGVGTFTMDRVDDADPEPWRRLGTAVALRWLCHRALVRSSNLATNLVLEQVGVAPVAATLAEVGATRSVVRRGIEDAAAREAGLDNLVTAADLARTLQAVATGRAATAAACRELMSVLGAQQINDAIPAGLPRGVRVAHKSGWVDGISHDAGVVFPDDGRPYVLVVCTTSELSESAGLDLIAGVSAAAYADRSAAMSPAGPGRPVTVPQSAADHGAP